MYKTTTCTCMWLFAWYCQKLQIMRVAAVTITKFWIGQGQATALVTFYYVPVLKVVLTLILLSQDSHSWQQQISYKHQKLSHKWVTWGVNTACCKDARWTKSSAINSLIYSVNEIQKLNVSHQSQCSIKKRESWALL